MRKVVQLFALATFMIIGGAAHADCGADSSEEGARNCLAQDLRDSDKRINATYKLLMGSLDDAGKLSLRDEQRAWLKNRDKACLLNTRESDREKWLQGILADKPMTVCVVRYTFARVAELDQQLKQKAPAKAAEAPAAPAAPKLSTSTTAGIDGSCEVKELVLRGLVKVNLGQEPFKFPKPEGYRAWGDL